MTGESAARCENGKSLSWRSRDSNWWTSAVELSNSLASKIDQVGFFLIPFMLSFFLFRVSLGSRVWILRGGTARRMLVGRNDILGDKSCSAFSQAGTSRIWYIYVRTEVELGTISNVSCF